MSEPGEVGGGRIPVLLAADASPWEQAALQAISAARPGLVLVKRCLDLADLLGSAATGTARVAVVSDRLAGLDADSIGSLARHGVRVVAVSSHPAPERRSADEEIAARTRLLRIGVARVLDAGAVAALAEQVRYAATAGLDPGRPASDDEEPDPRDDRLVESAPERSGRLLAVWGPAGAPGRTTVAIGVAAEAATRGIHTTLVDADPYGGSAAQHLAVLEEVSGLLAATRMANAGQLDRVRLARLAREVAPRLRLVSGLPRPDRWTEVRPQAFEELLTTARALDDLVVVDAGSGLPSATPDPFATAPARDDTTLATLEQADEVLVVASADPVGLTRVARSLRDLVELRPEAVIHVAVNRMRSTLGWSEAEVRGLVGRVAPTATVSFLPDDRTAADRALVSGRTLRECGDSSLRRAMAALSDLVLSGIEPARPVGRRDGLLLRAMRAGTLRR